MLKAPISFDYCKLYINPVLVVHVKQTIHVVAPFDILHDIWLTELQKHEFKYLPTL